MSYFFTKEVYSNDNINGHFGTCAANKFNGKFSVFLWKVNVIIMQIYLSLVTGVF